MLNTLARILIYGFLLWLTVFAASIAIFPIKKADPIFFETLISIILAAATVLYGFIYFNKRKNTLGECLTVGISWMIINIAIDLPMFSYGPMKRSFADYMTDIGLTYLMIPIIVLAFSIKSKPTSN